MPPKKGQSKWAKWIPWSQQELATFEEDSTRAKARASLEFQYCWIYNPVIFMTDLPCQANQSSKLRDSQKLASSRRVHFYRFFESSEKILSYLCITPIIYSLLTGRLCSEETEKRGMLIPLIGPGVDVEEWMTSEISKLSEISDLQCRWIKPDVK